MISLTRFENNILWVYDSIHNTLKTMSYIEICKQYTMPLVYHYQILTYIENTLLAHAISEKHRKKHCQDQSDAQQGICITLFFLNTIHSLLVQWHHETVLRVCL